MMMGIFIQITKALVIFSLNFIPDYRPSNSVSFIDFVPSHPNNLHTLNVDDRDTLTRPITLSKIYQTLKSMLTRKSLRPDGLNVDFNLLYWKVAKESLFKAINYFFPNYQPH